ncbi:protein of unknown function [Candidatus Methylacidiphilum fumarolicum]|uniref:Uncharacterized protein n=1 Tax=Candidatus Methylacidiphilum fumarolicum TaxID=591154 RepID=A0ABM9ID67_9BACT|nr:protein of unknown function [Candidatus Methylacidiphilum fumarolicum]
MLLLPKKIRPFNSIQLVYFFCLSEVVFKAFFLFLLACYYGIVKER